MSKWSGRYWADLGERVAVVAIAGITTMLTADASGTVSGNPKQWWLIVGLPVALITLKGLAANLADPKSGASLLPAPPGPVIEDVTD